MPLNSHRRYQPQDLGVPTPCNFSRNQIDELASRTAQRLGFHGGDDIESLVTEKLGGEIRYLELTDWLRSAEDTIEVRGPKQFTIFLSGAAGFIKNRFTIGHELGHYFLHSNLGEKQIAASRNEISERVEWEANWFATALLMPMKEVLRQRKLPVEHLAAQFLVPIEFARDRLARLSA